MSILVPQTPEDISDFEEDEVESVPMNDVRQKDRQWFLERYATAQSEWSADLSKRSREFIEEHFLVPVSKGVRKPSIEVPKDDFPQVLRDHIRTILGKEVHLEVYTSEQRHGVFTVRFVVK